MQIRKLVSWCPTANDRHLATELFNVTLVTIDLAQQASLLVKGEEGEGDGSERQVDSQKHESF